MRFSVEVDNNDPTALTWCLKKLEQAIPDYDYNWKIYINAGGIDYGIYLNIDIEQKEIEISNGSTMNTLSGDDFLDDVIDAILEQYGNDDDDDDERTV